MVEANPCPPTASTCTTQLGPPLATTGNIQQPTNDARDTTLQSTAAVQLPHGSSSAQIPSPLNPKLEEADADPTQNPLVHTCTLLPSYCDDGLSCLLISKQTLLSDYKIKPENVVVGFDSSYEVMPSDYTANTEQALSICDHVTHTFYFKYC